jgi:hypothetical protein
VPRAKSIVFYGGLCLILFTFMVKASGNIADLDLWHEMALAREAWQTGRVPIHDSFAYTPTLPVIVHHEWGAGVAALAFWNAFGGTGLMLLNFALAAGALCLALAVARRRGAGPWVLVFAALLTAPLMAGGFQPVRAQAYGFLFFCGALYCAERERAGSRWWMAAALALFPVWVNLHASCVLAFAVFGLLWIERPRWRIAGLLVAMAALLPANPYGGAYVTYLLRAVPKARPLIDEWHPVWTSEMLPLVALAGAIVVYALAVRRPRAEWTTVALLLLVALQAILHRKMIPFLAFAWLAYVPAWLEKTPLWQGVRGVLAEYEKLLRPVAIVALAGSALYLFSTRPWVLRIPDRDARPSYPVGPVRFLKDTGFHGRLLSHFEQGAYILWELSPAVRVAVDSRYEVAYPDDVVEAAVAVYQSGDWAAFTRQYPTDIILTQARYAKLEASLAAGQWKPVYRDGEYTLWRAPQGSM